jgi:hypothetical protein
VDGHEPLDHLRHVALLERLVHELVGRRVVLAPERILERALDALVEHDAADRGQHVVAAVAGPVLGQIVERHHAVLVRELRLLRRAEHVRALAVLLRVPLAREEHPLELGERAVVRSIGEVVGAQNHVLRRGGERRAVRRREDVVRRQHEQAGLRLGLG